GNIDDKALKNEACSKGIFARYRAEDFTGIRLIPEIKTVEIAKPMGVVYAALPATSPVAALFHATIVCLLTRNALIVSPHPAAIKSSVDVARFLAKVAEDAGAPDGTIQIIESPSSAITESLMKSDRVDLNIMLEGSETGPVYVDESANLARAARAVAEAKSFDNGVGFASESAIIAHAAIADRLREELAKNGCHICSDAECDKLESLLFPLAKFDANWIGKPASAISAKAGFKVPSRTRLLVVPLTRVGDDYPLSREKPCPVTGFYVAANRDSAMSACRAMVRGSGGGDCATIHSEDAAMILRFGSEMNVTRISVNASMVPISSGFATQLPPFDLSPDKLVRHVTIAWSADASVKMPSLAGISLPRPAVIGRPPHGEIDYDFGNPPPGAVKRAAKPTGKSRGKLRT
ncbi:MAG: aldehyde dehydrogenase family protein, partial [Rhizobiales bacterium]|nr:aldehyde dehydrogenase family protein [Hyphomicrobiales bacterium]